jgi:two-component system, chemotaxis family, sensor kinase CheA
MVNKNDELRARLLATFRVEAEEHLQVLTTNLLALGRGLSPSEAPKVIEVSFREMHTLKGAARSVGLLEVEALCQACESVLSKLSRGQLVLTLPTLKMLHDGVEHMPLLLTGGATPSAVSELISRLKSITDESILKVAQPVEVSEPPIPVLKAAQETGLISTNTIRLNTTKLDGLLLQAEDLLLPKLAAGERVQEVRALVETVRGCRTALVRERAVQRSPHVTSSTVAFVVDPDSVMQMVEARISAMLEHITHDHRTITSAVDGLQKSLRLLRMTPASVVLNLFPGMVRSLADELGKQVEWGVQGADLEVDRKVLDAMKDPLIHLVRNAIDHGIESPEARVKAGKPPQGQVAVTIASLEGNRVEIRVEDDGKGIDLDQVRAAAVRARHLTTEESQALTNDLALDLIYQSGLSTTPLISTVSGHGLGLAIVREQVEGLKGQIRVDTRLGVGTTVRITLPVTISTFRGLLVRTGGQSYLLPSEAVERTFHLLQREVEGTQGRPMVRWEGRPILLAQLTELLGLKTKRDPSGSDHKQPCVIMRVREARVGLVVDEVLGEQEVVVKELGSPLIRVRNVAGAGLLGTGHVILILRPADLLRSIRESPRAPVASHLAKEMSRQSVILVVDDSITTRTMEKNLLEAAGYQVRVAVDGIEAWTLLKSERVDLIVSDVDMPRMNGLELTAKIRANRDMADLPVILVTALESRDDKERGLEVGANAYLVKSSFDQSNLLEFIRRML